MVGKSRNTVKGTTRSTTGGAPGGGTVSGATGNNIQDAGMPDLAREGDIIDDALSADILSDAAWGVMEPDLSEELEDAEAITANIGSVERTISDLTGRDTPGGRIADLAQGHLPTDPQHPRPQGMGQGTRGNLGVKHGRSYQPGDTVIAGAGASPETTEMPSSQKQSGGEQGKETSMSANEEETRDTGGMKE